MRVWRYINILSLDIAVGAMTGCAFFAHLFGIVLLSHGLLSLGLIVWIIYTVDHLADANRSEGEPSTERHRFHKRWRIPLKAGVVLASILVGIEAFYVRKPVLVAGLGLGIVVIVYLFFQARLKMFKELTGALLYTAGVLVAPLSLLTRPLIEAEWSLIALFMLTAFANLLLYSWFDQSNDEQDGHVSMATVLGQKTTGKILMITFLVITVIGTLTIFLDPTFIWPIIFLLSMNALLFIPFQFRGYFSQKDRYRVVGDLAFLLPALYLLL
ncbi:MAG: hypothetical protein JNL40_15400 [Cyclobacteriaceae bacterium]|nr:hypothetical protein [Cyclobacteriaceae bacterium]